MKKSIGSCLLVLIMVSGLQLRAQDTLRVMTYNVIYYGGYPLCNSAKPNSVLHGYFETVAQYANADIIGIVKAGAIKLSPTNNNYTAPLGFADSILNNALNVAYAGRYAYCPFTNTSAANNLSVLFYNQLKLGFVALTTSYANTTDFDTWKLYYKDPNLSTTHDTTFLYVTLNHDISGSGSESSRGAQIVGEMQDIKTHFYHLANHINMGDFNTRNTTELCYQTLIAGADSNFNFYDPPFLDGALNYPADWDSNPASFTKYLTTSTRASSTDNCDNGGGAKDWYDHIFISHWISNNSNYIQYIPHSYRTLGNDGARLGISVNDAPTNSAVPANVANAIYGLSDKYPVMIDLLVSPNTTGISPSDPEIPTGISTIAPSRAIIKYTNPVSSNLELSLDNLLLNKNLSIEVYTIYGQLVLSQNVAPNSKFVSMPFNFASGVYVLKIAEAGQILMTEKLIKL